jgi:alcohol dehydrogenase class IV
MASSLRMPDQIITGPGALTSLPACVRRFGSSAMLVTGRTFARRVGLTERIVTDLAHVGCSVACFEDVGPEPDLATCDVARKFLAQHACDVVIAVGGGSVLDVGKVVAGLANESQPSLDYWNGALPDRPGVPFIAIPTTSGSGSEVTPNGVITNPDIPTKRSIRDNSFMARVAIVDPELTRECPPNVTAHSGMDALCQALESFISLHATPATDAFALAAVSLVADGLEAAWSRPDDMLARTSVATGSLFAGISMTNARAGVVHGLAHPLGARLGMAHGRICAILLPWAMRLNRSAAPDKFTRLDMTLGGDADEFVHGLLVRFGIPTRLPANLVPRADFDAIIEDTLQSGSTKANPKLVTADDCRQVLDLLLS